MNVPAGALGDTLEVARENGTNVRKKAAELFDNSYVEQLSKSGCGGRNLDDAYGIGKI